MRRRKEIITAAPSAAARRSRLHLLCIQPTAFLLLAILLVTAVCTSLAGDGYAPYIQRAGAMYAFAAAPDEEVTRYFSEIAAIRSNDAAAAAKNYQKFIERFGDRVVLHEGACLPVRRQVFDLIGADPDLLAEYRRQFEPAARQAFDRAGTAHDPEAMQAVQAAYFACPSGLQAVRYLALYHADHGALDRARYYLDLIDGPPFEVPDAGEMHAVLDRIGGAERAAGGPEGPDLNALIAARPSWVGGIATSTVFPDDVASFVPTRIVYSLVREGDRISVNTGTDVYTYDVRTGRHIWSPGAYHQARIRSIWKGDTEAAPRTQRGESGYAAEQDLHFPAGGLLPVDGRLLAVFNKIEGPNQVALLNRESGAIEEVFSGPRLAAMGGKADADTYGWFMGFRPGAGDGTVFLTLHNISDRREQCRLVCFSIAENRALWSRELYEAQLTFARRSGPLETVVLTKGSYVCVFSFAGYAGVFNAWDGALVWERYLLPPEKLERGYVQVSSYFLPVIIPDGLLIEGPEKEHLTCYAISTGRRRFSLAGGVPLWAAGTESGAAVAVRRTEGTVLLGLSPADGTVQWEYRDVSLFPGSSTGAYVYCTDGLRVLKVEAASGTLAGSAVLNGCLFPGALHVDNRGLFIVNTAGMFRYDLP